MSHIKCKKILNYATIVLIAILIFNKCKYCYVTEARLFSPKYLNTNNTEKCYEGLGCINITNEWIHRYYRPENLFPSDRHAVNTIFVHWLIKSEVLTHHLIDTAHLKHSSIRSPLKVLIHDFTGNGYAPWVQHMAKGIQQRSRCYTSTVVSVDWAAGAEPPYVQAVANTRLVALEIQWFLKKLVRCHFIPANGTIHLIGHGLGAHIAGYVGKTMRIRQITALDPSGPFFRGMPAIVKLTKRDAEFVEVLHTNANSLYGKFMILLADGQGNKELMGHVDLYASGGKKQPGCHDFMYPKVTFINRAALELGQVFPGCSHERSLTYYIEALMNPTCTFAGIACPNYRDFLQGKCAQCGDNNELCYDMEPCRVSKPKYLNNTNGFQFLTSNSAPFCTEVLRIVLQFAANRQLTYLNGFFNVTIPQKRGNVIFTLRDHDLGILLSNASQAILQTSFIVYRSTPPILHLPIEYLHIKWVQCCMKCDTAPPQILTFQLQKVSAREFRKIQKFCTDDLDISVDSSSVKMLPCPTNRTTELLRNQTYL